jgi:2-methylcitrate dehydratase
LDKDISQYIAEFASRIEYKNLMDKVIQEVKVRILDTIGCAFGAIWSNASSIARRALYRHRSLGWGARIWGSDIWVPPDYATFINGLMARYLDFNDTYLSKEPQHPSDMIPALIALGEYLGVDGKTLITGVAVGYEVGMRLCDAASLRVRGWDHVNYTMIGATAGLANISGLEKEEAVNAIAMAMVPHVAMRQTRAGKITMWKAAAASNACRNAVFAVLLAMEGYEGPSDPFIGEMAFIRQLLGEFDYSQLTGLALNNNPTKILESYMKFHPVEYHAQSAVDATLKILNKGINVEDIERIKIDTVQAAYDIIVKHPEKWDPDTRETADHSLPYIVASTLANRGVWIDNFEGDELYNPITRKLMEKTEVSVDKELDTMYPSAIPNRVSVKLKDGRYIEELVEYPVGHPKNPPSIEMVIEKFVKLTDRVLSERNINNIIDIVMDLEKVEDISILTEAMVI